MNHDGKNRECLSGWYLWVSTKKESVSNGFKYVLFDLGLNSVLSLIKF